jgi:hypothetical protein
LRPKIQKQKRLQPQAGRVLHLHRRQHEGDPAKFDPRLLILYHLDWLARSLVIFISDVLDDLGEDLAGAAVVEAGVHGVDGVEGVVEDCSEAGVLQVDLDLWVLLVVDKQPQLLPLLVLLLLPLQPFLLPVVHRLLLLVQRGDFLCCPRPLLILFVETPFEGNLDIVIVSSVLFVAALPPVGYHLLLRFLLASQPSHLVFLFELLLVDVVSPIDLVEFGFRQFAPVLFLERGR